MSNESHLPPIRSEPGELAPASDVYGSWRAQPPQAESGGLNLGRYLSALRRRKWILVLATLLAAGAGTITYRLVQPTYVANASLMLRPAPRGGGTGSGPIAQSQILESTSWVGLLRSYIVLDSVAVQQRLFVKHDPADAALFTSFSLQDRAMLGSFTLTVSPDGTRYVIANADGVSMASGRVGEPLAAALGFNWNPPVEELRARREAAFTVTSPRDAARELTRQLATRMDENAAFITLEMRGRDPARLGSTLSAIQTRFVKVAAERTNSQAVIYRDILGEQLETVEDSLRQAEVDLLNFRVRTITQPSEESAPVTAGLDESERTVVDEYQEMRLELDALQRDRQRLEAIVAQIPVTGVSVTAFELIERVGSATVLQAAFDELMTVDAEMRELGQRYTAEHPRLKELTAQKASLENGTIVAAANTLIAELRNDEAARQSVIDSRGRELEEIPPRSIEEAQLQRRVVIADGLYSDLRERYETANLAAASAVPDVSILDTPTVPQVPDGDQRMRFTAMAVLAFLGLGVGAVILLDQFDPRLRHPSDVLHRIGLDIVGAIPRVDRARKGTNNLDGAREAFRELRMRLQYGYGSANKPMLLAVTSPAKGEGKTFVTANLAIAFSELGVRTLLIDADTRQGNMHELLQRERKPGLTDALTGLEEGRIVQTTEYNNLYFMGFGSRNVNSPDLLNSTRMQELLALAKRHYDLILFDCPPMGAGSDAFVLAAHTGNVIVVLRTGSTNKEFALAKLEPFYRLPVRILGAVLNDVDHGSAYGQYRYYSSYLPGYHAVGENGESAEAITK